MWLGYRNCLKHWISSEVLIIIVFEWGMNFPVSREQQQQQQKSPQQTPGCLKRLLSSLRASTPLLAQERSAVLNNQTRRKGCEQLFPKGLGINKGHIRKIGEWGLGGTIQKCRGVIGRVCFPDSFQRKEICVVCCGAENTVQDQLMFFFIQQLLSLAHSF